MESLCKDPNALAVLTLVAFRARREPCPVTGLQVGQAYLGYSDFSESMGRQQYRLALKRLQKYGFATVQGTNRGTIAGLMDRRLYDINDSLGTDLGTIQEPSRNHPGTTNKKERKKELKKQTIPPQLDQVVAYFLSKSQSTAMANEFFDHYESNGWKVGGKAPMKKWTAAVGNWIRRQENFNGPSKGPHRQGARATARDLLTDTTWASPTDQPAFRDTVGDVSDVPAR